MQRHIGTIRHGFLVLKQGVFVKRIDIVKLLLCSLCSLIGHGPALSQGAYPERPVTIIVPFAAGTGADIGARMLARYLAETMKANIIVDNKPGANGAIGAQAAARAKPDGYTLMLGSATTNAVNYAFFPGKLGYEPGTFIFIGSTGASPISLYVSNSSPSKNVADLLAEARLKPGKLSCGSGNAVTQVACEIFKLRTGIDFVTVPYKSNPQSLTDLVGGQLSFAFADAAVSQAFLDGKKMRTIGVAAKQRNPATPEAATFQEQGMGEFEITAWTAVFAPAGIPGPVAESLNAALLRFSDSPEAVNLRLRSGSVATPFDLPHGQQFVANEVARWARYVKDSGVKPE